jgi:hypothetical protein
MNPLYALPVFALPLISSLLLSTAKSDGHRRMGNWLVAITLFGAGGWYFLVRWGIFSYEEMKARYGFSGDAYQLFRGRGAALMNYFINDPRLFVVYLLGIALIAYCANKRAVQRFRTECS